MTNLFRRLKVTAVAMLLVPLLLSLPLQTDASVSQVSLVDEVKSSSSFWTTHVSYLALGDSLAAGMDFNGGMGKGYPDYLAEEIESAGYLQSYSNGFSYPGYTAAKVLADLEENVIREINGVPTNIQDAVQSSELITISAGANDVLGLIDIDNETGEVKFDQAQLTQAIQQVGANTMKIIMKINELNPKAQVYVMGYYNPFPQLPAHIQPTLDVLLKNLNMAIGMATDNPNVHFVETGKVIAESPLTYLPNAGNIHLNEAGYRKVSEQFWAAMKESYVWTPMDSLTAELIEPNKVVLNWKQPHNHTNIKNYELYVGEDKIATVASDVLTYTVENLEADQLYQFAVSAVDQEGVRSPHNPVVEMTTGVVAPLFSDIKEHWAQEFIENAAIAGILKGHLDGSFKPNKDLTRAQAASILVRALKLQADETAPFKDVKGYAPETQAEINAAYKYGLVKGSKGKFMPSAVVTRSQLALMIDRAYTVAKGKKYIVSSHAPYTDYGHADEETVNAISVLYELGIATGTDGKFNPSGSTSRAQAAKMFMNFSLLQ